MMLARLAIHNIYLNPISANNSRVRNMRNAELIMSKNNCVCVEYLLRNYNYYTTSSSFHKLLNLMFQMITTETCLGQ